MKYEPMFAGLLREAPKVFNQDQWPEPFDILRRSRKFIIDGKEFNDWTDQHRDLADYPPYCVFSTCPYSCIWIEFYDSKECANLSTVLKPGMRKENGEVVKESGLNLVYSGLGYDINKSKAIFFGAYKSADPKKYRLYEIDINNPKCESEKDILHSLFWYTEYLKFEHVDAVHQTVKIGPSRFKRGKLISRHVSEYAIVYRKRPILDQIAGSSSTEPMEHDYRWKVRGHWRRVKGFGRGPEGAEIEGFTWIKEHERGPDDKPLLDRPNILKNRLPPKFIEIESKRA